MADDPGSALRFLGDRTPAEFMETYWQKEPLLVRNAVPGFRTPLSPEELAGLACEPDSLSRLVLEEGGTRPWELREGPFEEETFLALPETGWSLLVQEVDRRVPAVHELLDRVAFLPRWRVDDVMVSYAPDEGSVGAHLDNYDVFLLQGLGRRRWQIEERARAPGDRELVPDLDVQVLADFDPDLEWVLEPGDVLYLPPRVPHRGVAEGRCMTYSIGFRAPSHRRIVMGFMQELAEQASREKRYADAEARPRARSGLVTEEDLDRVRGILEQLWTRASGEGDWFGRMVTTPQRGGHAPPPADPIAPSELRSALARGVQIRRSEASRFAYRIEDTGRAVLYVDGTAHRLNGPAAGLAKLLGEHDEPPPERLSGLIEDETSDEGPGRTLALLTELFNDGRIYAPDGLP